MSLFLFWAVLSAAEPGLPWPQWGGPNRDFRAASLTLAPWPASGPKILWKRTLGDGYASFVSDGKAVYTTFRKGERTAVVALNPETGATVWETAFDSPFIKGEMNPSMGTAAASTPLLSGGRLYAVTFTGLLVALDRASGRTI